MSTERWEERVEDVPDEEDGDRKCLCGLFNQCVSIIFG